MSPIGYQDFDLKIELIPGTDNRYCVEVSNSPSGQAKGKFDLPFSEQELDSLRHTGLPTLEGAKDFGCALFTSVFTDQIYTCLQRSFDAAHSKGQGVRIRLRLTDAPALADLPWEFLFDPHANRFLAASTITSLVRYLDLP